MNIDVECFIHKSVKGFIEMASEADKQWKEKVDEWIRDIDLGELDLHYEELEIVEGGDLLASIINWDNNETPLSLLIPKDHWRWCISIH